MSYSDAYIYTFLIVVLYFFVRVWISIESYPKTLPIRSLKRFLYIFSVTIIGSLFFYWLLRNTSSLESGFSTWFIALDISLAHVTVTLPIILLFIFLAWDIVRGISFLVGALVHNLSKSDYESKYYELEMGRGCSALLLFVLIVFLVIKFVLINTVDLQLFLFGNHDPSLGFKFPTTYRFSVVFSHLQELYGNISSDLVIASIFGFVVIITGVVLSVSSIGKAISDWEAIFPSRKK